MKILNEDVKDGKYKVTKNTKSVLIAVHAKEKKYSKLWLNNNKVYLDAHDLIFDNLRQHSNIKKDINDYVDFEELSKKERKSISLIKLKSKESAKKLVDKIFKKNKIDKKGIKGIYYIDGDIFLKDYNEYSKKHYKEILTRLQKEEADPYRWIRSIKIMDKEAIKKNKDYQKAMKGKLAEKEHPIKAKDIQSLKDKIYQEYKRVNESYDAKFINKERLKIVLNDIDQYLQVAVNNNITKYYCEAQIMFRLYENLSFFKNHLRKLEIGPRKIHPFEKTKLLKCSN